MRNSDSKVLGSTPRWEDLFVVDGERFEQELNDLEAIRRSKFFTHVRGFARDCPKLFAFTALLGEVLATL
jgi:hypothetical protein